MGPAQRCGPSCVTVSVEGMHRRAHRFAVLLPVLALVALLGSCESTPTGSFNRSKAALSSSETDTGATTSAPREFTFAAAGDLGANPTTADSLRNLDASSARFFLAVGDLDYDQTATDRAWCRYVKDRLPRKGARYPFELLVGNHEADGGEDGLIRHHAACLPDRLDSRGRYARQYVFTFPRTDPFAKFIMIAPRLTADGHTYRYDPGTADREWLVNQIDRARANGIKWVVVGAHYPCLSTGSGHPGCASGHAVHNLLLRKGVDVILNGHNHVYERSSQLALSPSCPRIPPGEYDADCVVDSGVDSTYAKGAGTVQVTSGRFGGRPMTVNRADPDLPYFVAADAGTTGYTQFRVTPTSMEATYVASTGSFQDSFVIGPAG